MTKRMSIFLKESIYRICPNIQTTEGAWKGDLFVIFLEQDVPLVELGQKILNTLGMPRKIIPHPQSLPEANDRAKKWYKAMKIKSWKSFAKNAKDLELILYENKIEIMPTKNEQPKGFFEFLSEKSRFCPIDDPEALGQAIIDAFNDCE